jgi:hypothetical protein
MASRYLKQTKRRRILEDAPADEDDYKLVTLSFKACDFRAEDAGATPLPCPLGTRVQFKDGDLLLTGTFVGKSGPTGMLVWLDARWYHLVTQPVVMLSLSLLAKAPLPFTIIM